MGFFTDGLVSVRRTDQILNLPEVHVREFPEQLMFSLDRLGLGVDGFHTCWRSVRPVSLTYSFLYRDTGEGLLLFHLKEKQVVEWSEIGFCVALSSV